MITPLISYAAKTTPGPQLEINEDAINVCLVNNIFMVLDGFGGLGIGDVAVKFVKESILDFYSNTCSDPDSTLPYFYDPKYLLELNVLINSIHHVHKSFQKDNLSREVNVRAGLSLLVGLYVDGLFMTISTGNCLGLLKRKNNVSSITKPDTLEDYSMKKTDRMAQTFPADAFGLYNKLNLNISELRVEPGDQIILCSDGVYSYQTSEEINYILSKNHLTNSKKVQEIFSLSNIRGNWDNQSLILLNF